MLQYSIWNTSVYKTNDSPKVCFLQGETCPSSRLLIIMLQSRMRGVLLVLVVGRVVAWELTLLHVNDIHVRMEETNKYSAACRSDQQVQRSLQVRPSSTAQPAGQINKNSTACRPADQQEQHSPQVRPTSPAQPAGQTDKSSAACRPDQHV